MFKIIYPLIPKLYLHKIYSKHFKLFKNINGKATAQTLHKKAQFRNQNGAQGDKVIIYDQNKTSRKNLKVKNSPNHRAPDENPKKSCT